MGERIRSVREQRGMNKNQVARALGTSWQHFDHWERGRVEPALASIRRIAEILGTSTDYLLGLRDDPTLPGSALETFLASLAPSDLTPQEAEWLAGAPVDHAVILPRDYATLLGDLRAVGSPRRPESATRAKIDRAAIERKIEKIK